MQLWASYLDEFRATSTPAAAAPSVRESTQSAQLVANAGVARVADYEEDGDGLLGF
jgi:hypothetical protein